jgi:hypothetical protein
LVGLHIMVYSFEKRCKRGSIRQRLKALYIK